MLRTKDIYMKACMQSKDLYVMTDSERLRLQGHLKMMYLEIEKICENHNLKMCAAYGTVLGAIRHHGFIPWDDDMDLIMPRKDYDKFINIYANELPKNLKVYAPNSKNGPITRFAKVVDVNTRFIEPGAVDEEKNGIFIDIFPLEGTDSNKIFIRVKYIISCLLMLIASTVMEYEESVQNKMYRRLMCASKEGKKVYKIRQKIGKIFSFYNSIKWLNIVENYTKCSKIKSGFSVPVGGADIKYFKPLAPTIYFPARKVEFDDIKIYIPNDAEKHCQLEYGNWRKIPSVEERWQHFLQKISFDNSEFKN